MMRTPVTIDYGCAAEPKTSSTTLAALFRQTCTASFSSSSSGSCDSPTLARSASFSRQIIVHRFLPAAIAIAANSSSPSPRLYGRDVAEPSDVSPSDRCGYRGHDVALPHSCDHCPSPFRHYGHDMANLTPLHYRTSHCTQCRCPHFPSSWTHFGNDVADLTPPPPHFNSIRCNLLRFPSPGCPYGHNSADSTLLYYRTSNCIQRVCPPHCPSPMGSDTVGSHYQTSHCILFGHDSATSTRTIKPFPCMHRSSQERDDGDAYNDNDRDHVPRVCSCGFFFHLFHMPKFISRPKESLSQLKDNDRKNKLHLSMKTFNIFVTNIVNYVKAKHNNLQPLEFTNELQQLKLSKTSFNLHQNKSQESIHNLQLNHDLRNLRHSGKTSENIHKIENREIIHSLDMEKNGFEVGLPRNKHIQTAMKGPPLPSSPTHSWLGKAIPNLSSRSSFASYMLNKEKDHNVSFARG